MFRQSWHFGSAAPAMGRSGTFARFHVAFPPQRMLCFRVGALHHGEAHWTAAAIGDFNGHGADHKGVRAADGVARLQRFPGESGSWGIKDFIRQQTWEDSMETKLKRRARAKVMAMAVMSAAMLVIGACAVKAAPADCPMVVPDDCFLVTNHTAQGGVETFLVCGAGDEAGDCDVQSVSDGKDVKLFLKCPEAPRSDDVTVVKC